MEVAAVKLAASLTDKLLAKYGIAPSACQIERLFKPAAFFLDTVPSLNLVLYSKRRQFNMNITPEEQYQQPRNQVGNPRNRGQDYQPTSSTGGRGRYNKNFWPLQQSNARYTPNHTLQ
jgi:hypothetical protein